MSVEIIIIMIIMRQTPAVQQVPLAGRLSPYHCHSHCYLWNPAPPRGATSTGFANTVFITTHTGTHRHIPAHTRTHRHTPTHTGTHRHIPTHTDIHQNKPTHTDTHRHTPTHWHTLTHTVTHRHTHTQKHTHTHKLQ